MHEPALRAGPRRRHRGRQRPAAPSTRTAPSGTSRCCSRAPTTSPPGPTTAPWRRRRRPKPAGRGRLARPTSCCRSASAAARCSWRCPHDRPSRRAGRAGRPPGGHRLPAHHRPASSPSAASRRSSPPSTARSSWRRGWTRPRPSSTSSRPARRCARTACARSRPCSSPRRCCWPAPASTTEQRAIADELATVIESVMAARGRRYLMLNAPDDSLDSVDRAAARARLAHGAAAGARRHARRPRRRRPRARWSSCSARCAPPGARSILVLPIDNLIP